MHNNQVEAPQRADISLGAPAASGWIGVTEWLPELRLDFAWIPVLYFQPGDAEGNQGKFWRGTPTPAVKRGAFLESCFTPNREAWFFTDSRDRFVEATHWQNLPGPPHASTAALHSPPRV